MDPEYGSNSYVEQCSCKRTFLSPAALKNHQNSCLTSKARITAILAKAKVHLPDASVRKERILAIGKRKDQNPVLAGPSVSEVQTDATETVSDNVRERAPLL